MFETIVSNPSVEGLHPFSWGVFKKFTYYTTFCALHDGTICLKLFIKTLWYVEGLHTIGIVILYSAVIQTADSQADSSYPVY